MKKVFPMIAFATCLLASCSSTTTSRHVANEIHPEAKETVESLFTIKASNISLADEDLQDKTLTHLKTLMPGSDIKIELKEDDLLINETLFKIEGYQNVLCIKYAEDAFKDHAATLNLIRFMDALLGTNSPSFFELYQNSINNDFASLYAIAKIRRSVLTPLESNPEYDPINLSQYNGYVKGETIIWNKKLSELAKIEKKKTTEKRKANLKKSNEELEE